MGRKNQEELGDKDFVKGERETTRTQDAIEMRMRMEKIISGLKIGKRYTLRFQSYTTSAYGREEAVGKIIRRKMELLGKYRYGALFLEPGGYRQFFTWKELASGGLAK